MATAGGATPSAKRALFAVWGVLMLVGIAAEALTLANRATWDGPETAFGTGTVFAATYGLAGALILSRQPANPVGRVFLYVTTVMVVMQFASEYAIYAFLPGNPALPLRDLFGWLSQWTFFTAFPLGMTLIFLSFPDGIRAGKKWKAVLILAIAGGLVLTLGFLLAQGPINPAARGNGAYTIPLQNPTGVLPDPDKGLAGAVQGIGWAGSGLALIISVIALVVRLFRETGERRQQLKWVAYFAAPVAPAFAIHFFNLALLNGAFPDITKPIYIAIYLVGIPTAMAIAILKYRLYGIDVVISRTLVYGSLAAFITAVYVGIVVGVGSLIGSGGKPNLVLSIIATAIVAVAFQPVRERLNRVANRIVYGKRATPYEVLSQFSERVAETYAADEALPRMARVLAEGTGAERAEVWLRSGVEIRTAAAWPESKSGNGSAPAVPSRPMPVRGHELPELPGDRAAAVMHQGELLGALTVSKRRGETLTPVEEKLLADLASQAGLVLKNVGLTAELLARLDDLRASRQRLVAAQDEERRRLERNLHDGAQQNLVAIKVKLGLAESLAAKDPAKAKEMVSQLKADTDEALETLRDLARGIYPPLLADKGLAAALEAQARKATVPVEVDADGVGRYPQETEAAVYFCVLEALQNVQKYAAASSAAVRLREDADRLEFEVADDGEGFDPATRPRGSGLTNMADRLEALGGDVDIQSSPGAGTRLHGRIPIVVGAGLS
ncbi:MAG: sensor histidine kinase [Candidatus Dormiibacterota bacterium]